MQSAIIKYNWYYFGSDRKEALQRYLNQSTYLHGCQDNLQKPTSDNMTLKQLCDMYLKYQYSKLQASDLTASHHSEQIGSLNKLIAFAVQRLLGHADLQMASRYV